MMRALIADDDVIAATIVSRTLTNLGFDVTVARDGAAAWDVLKTDAAPPLAILDWMMPGLDGPEVCKLVRRDAPRPHAYLILLTARDASADVVAGLDAGADDYVVKPVDLAELQARVRVGIRVLGLQEGLAVRVAELQTALSQVKQLSGLLPICSYCKRVRNDDNYWQQVDSYIAQHTEAQFSHGICPPCFAEVSKQLDEYGTDKPPKGRITI